MGNTLKAALFGIGFMVLLQILPLGLGLVGG